MTEKQKAAPSGNSDAAEKDQSSTEVYVGKPTEKTGRTRYIRLFPERVYLLLAQLSDRELVAYLRFVTHYAVAGKAPVDDDKALARVAAMPAPAWSRLKSTLMALGIVEVVAGSLVDADQQKNLDIQAETSERQRQRVLRRYRR